MLPYGTVTFLFTDILLVIMLIPIPTVFISHNKKVKAILKAALAEGYITPELTAALNGKKNTITHHAEEIIVLVVAALMVLRPF